MKYLNIISILILININSFGQFIGLKTERNLNDTVGHWIINKNAGEHSNSGTIYITENDTCTVMADSSGKLKLNTTKDTVLCLSKLKIGEYTLPKIDGSASETLTTDGMGGVTWQSASSSSSDTSYGHIRAIRPNNLDTLYSTIDAALTAATTGWYLEVFPGTYQVETDPPDSITLYCHEGAVITSNDTLFDLRNVYGFVLDGRAELNATNFVFFTDSARYAMNHRFKKAKSTSSKCISIYNNVTRYNHIFKADSVSSYGDDAAYFRPITADITTDFTAYSTAGNGIYLNSSAKEVTIKGNSKTISPTDYAIYVAGSVEDTVVIITNNGMIDGGLYLESTYDIIHFTQNGNVKGNCYVKAPTGTMVDLVINGNMNNGIMTFYGTNNFAAVTINGNLHNYHVNVSGTYTSVVVNSNNYNIENIYNSTRFTNSAGYLTVNGYIYVNDITNIVPIFTNTGGTTYCNANIDYRGDDISVLSQTSGSFELKGAASGTSASDMLSQCTISGGTFFLNGGKLSMNPTTLSASSYNINGTGNYTYKHMGGILYSNNAADHCINVATGIVTTVKNYLPYYVNKARQESGTGVYNEVITGGGTEIVDTDTD